MNLLNISDSDVELLCKDNFVDFLGVFGSHSKNEQNEDSDLDLLVRFKNDKKITFIDLENIHQNFSKFLNKKIDLVTTDSISPFIRDSVMREVKPIYGQI